MGLSSMTGRFSSICNCLPKKSGDEIAGQLFSFTDRGGRDLALRPEMTPTLARMVNQQINSLARPIKWFTAPRLFRAERPQRGRLREFFQWNVDVIGSDLILADAECIYTAIDFLRSVGLKSDDLVVRISSRAMLAELLKSVGFDENQLDPIYALLDKVPKVPSETFAAMAAEQIPDDNLREKLMLLQGIDTLDELKKFAPESAQESIVQFESLFDHLKLMGVADYCSFDIKIVRGLAYYTGPVYEIFDRKEPLRAVCGGGRYDNLLSGLGGQHVPATGFGMGDVVLELMLKERGLVVQSKQQLDFFVVDAGDGLYEKSLEVACTLREKGFSAVINYKRQVVGKQLKQAGVQNARWAVILGEETIKDKQVSLKDLAEGTQKTVDLEEFLAEPETFCP
ncbi:MAG: histidine--tRNA ligase [Planctomycetes bacterium]|nr:histidine--tRNA ligase [Planctomycetota bacterium]